MHSGRSMDNLVTQTSLPAERFDLRHRCHTQKFLLTWSCKLTPSLREVMGVSAPHPRKVRGIGESIKQTLVLGIDAREQGVS